MRPSLLVAGLLIVVTLAAFGQVVGFGFLTVDDGPYVTQNPTVLAGLTGYGLRWAFGLQESNWHPLTWWSLMLDAQLGGSGPGVFHATNLVLHLVDTLLLFWVLVRMTGAVWRSGFAAALFGIHPQHVESVAWIVERKDVLSTFFWLLALHAYVSHVRRPTAVRWLLVAGAFVAGLLSKPMVVTLPLTLLLLDFWPLRRVADRSRAKGGWPRLWLEKLPLFGLSAAAGVVTVVAQSSGGAMSGLDSYPFVVRLGNAAVSSVTYVVKTVWPTRLAYFYPHPGSSLSPAAAVGAAALLLGASVAAWRARARLPYLTFGWFWYLITLAPVAGVVQVGQQARADRYTYVPLVGLFVAAAWGAAKLARPAETASVLRRRLVAGSCTVAVAVLAVAAHGQAGFWRDSVTLYRRALAVTTDNAVAHANLSLALLERGDLDGAIQHGREALRLQPSHPEAPNHLATALTREGRYDEAIATYEAALALRPDDATLHSNLGTVLAGRDRLDEAAAQFREALRLAPASVDAHNNLGVLFARQGRCDEAIAEFTAALRSSPFDEEVRANLARARSLRGDAPAR